MADDVKEVNPVEGLIELGSTGLKRAGGQVFEEFLPALSGTRAVRVYKEMSKNDATVGALLFAIEMILRQVDWSVEPFSQSEKHQAAAEFLESCLDDMSQTWENTIAEILSMLVYGWSWHEIVYKKRGGPEQEDPAKRSKYNDNRIGWRKIPIRSQDTLVDWIFDEDGGIRAMKQAAPPNFALVEIPIEKSLLFRTTTKKGNPEGESILRTAYRPWYYKRRIEEIEAIGVERDLAGLPVITPPENMNIWNAKDPTMVAMRREAERVVRNIRRDQNEGIVKPFGWELELLSSGGRRQMDTGGIIERYDRRILMTCLADFILLGHEKVGSFALASSKTDLFAVALAAWLDEIENVFNEYAIPRLFRLNPGLANPGELPKLKHGDIESRDLVELSTYIKDMTGVGLLTPDPEMEKYLRQVGKLPDLPEGIPSQADPEAQEAKAAREQEAALALINAKAGQQPPVDDKKGKGQLFNEQGLRGKAKQAAQAVKDKLNGKKKPTVSEAEDDEED